MPARGCRLDWSERAAGSGMICHRRSEELETEIIALGATAVPGGRPCPERCYELRLRQQERRDLADNKARAYALATQRCLYDVGDKANKLTAWLAGRDRGRNWVVAVRDETGKTCMTSGDIAKAFAEYYERLYESRAKLLGVDCADLLKDVSLQALSMEDRGELKEELSEEEVGQAIQELQFGKAGGPNGIPVEL
ncbi:hypothetical protein NDU88_006047 [Pleurodeles waltl]|uniref:Uncharacterized protein n=1 Tax=Pleurodeles waltl TaxID=8319 RepID=A0AAV7SNG1_PLEWA|nr:hypothetical protein NDU88_006047 [Pleurodeles waltl]